MAETRREFLDTLLFTSLAATALAVAAPIPFYLMPPEGSMRRRPVSAGADSGLAEGDGVNIMFGGMPAVVIRVRGKLRAYSRMCTHRACSVNWESDRGHFKCPCHGAIFDDNGAVVNGPTKLPLESLRCRVDTRGEIIVGG